MKPFYYPIYMHIVLNTPYASINSSNTSSRMPQTINICLLHTLNIRVCLLHALNKQTRVHLGIAPCQHWITASSGCTVQMKSDNHSNK